MSKYDYIFVGWAAVSSKRQAGEEKISLTDQLCANIMHSRKYGHMLCQLIVPGESRYITLFSEAESQVVGYRLDDTFDGLEGQALADAVEAKVKTLATTVNPYQELKHLIDTKQFNVLVFRDLGRIGRDAALSITITRLCHRSNIATYSTKSPPPSLASGDVSTYHNNLVDAISAVGYQNEIHQIQERHRAGMIRRVQLGKFPNAVPFGWRGIRDDKGKIDRYEINEDEARIVRLIIDLYLNGGHGGPYIADYLNSRNIPTPTGREWQPTHVKSILYKRWRYAGFAELNKNGGDRPYVKARGTWPPIISEETAHAIGKERELRAKARKSVSNTYRYSLMCYCDTCNERMRVHRSKYRSKKTGKIRRTTRYQCNHCGISIMEKYITDYVRDVILELQRRINERGIEAEATTHHQISTQDEIDAIHNQISRVSAGIERADLDYYVRATIDAERHSAIVAAANNQLAALQVELTRLEDALRDEEHENRRSQRIIDICENGLAMLEDKDVRRANAWLRKNFEVRIQDSKTITGVVAI